LPASLSISGDSGIGGGSGSENGGSGGGAGDDDDDAEDDDADENKRQNSILLRWKGWQERVAADPSFPYKVFIEQVGWLLICSLITIT
jgi:hypothetical protein